MAKSVKRKQASESPRTEAPYASVEERRAKGRALRDTVPRVSQAGWKPAKGRRDPVDLLSESNAGRVESLIPIRFGRMSASPFAFYRGSAALMAADLAKTPTSGTQGAGLRRCPPDELRRLRHARAQRDLRHQRSRRDAAGAVRVGSQAARGERRDRCAAPASCATATRRRVATDLVREYRERMADYASMRALDVWYDKIDLATV